MEPLLTFLEYGVLSTYTHFEATELFFTRGKGLTADCVLTVLVAEDHGKDDSEAPAYIGDRIKIKDFDGWTFGVKRYTRHISDLIGLLNGLEKTDLWEGAHEQLQFGSLHRVPPQFVPPDSTTHVPWNRVLKNNFWNGSYVFEWSDSEKLVLAPLFRSPPSLQELAGKFLSHVPIDIAGFSDRLGNLVVQLPVNSVIAKWQPHRNGECHVEIAWRPGVKPRPLKAISHFDFDGTIAGFVSADVHEPKTVLTAQAAHGRHRAFLWDEEHDILLAAVGPTGFIESIRMNVAIGDHEPRTFTYIDANGSIQCPQIILQSSGLTSIVGEPNSDDTGGRTRKRLYDEQEQALKDEKAFVQYNPINSSPMAERQRALDDIRSLVNQYGQMGACLWDPYLDAVDVLETLFWSRHSRAELRALTAAARRPDEAHEAATTGQTRKQVFTAKQRDALNSVEGNLRGLRFEFRVRLGQAGWGFHDRFLILPQRDSAALAWSLGTSINSLGTEHHIFQKVSEGQLVLNAFDQLWKELSASEHLIWKRP